MSYVSWAVLYEGDSDASYFNVLIPRLLEHIGAQGRMLPTVPLEPALRFRRSAPSIAAQEICAALEAFHLLFIHADTGGRALQKGMPLRGQAYCNHVTQLCGVEATRCIVIAPSHETEAWVLADPEAVTEMLGFNGTPASIHLPPNANAAERLIDPKATLQEAVSLVRGRRRTIPPAQLFPAIANRQRIARLQASASFRNFETDITAALASLGF